MDKWKNNKGKFVVIREDSLLPPTRRISSITPPPSLDKRRSKKWSIDGIFKSVFSKLDAQSSSSSFDDLSKRQRRKIKGKPKGGPKVFGHGSKGGGAYAGVNGSGSANNNGGSGGDHPSMNQEQQQPSNAQSRSSDGSVDGRRALKDKVKARAEAKRDRLGASDSSTDESSGDEAGRRRHEPKKRTSRASRTERYLKRMCNGAGNPQRIADSRSIESRGRAELFRPIERVPRLDSALANGAGHVDNQPIPCFDNGLPTDLSNGLSNDLPNGNYYGQQEETGVNVLIQQTLQYFNDFERNMEATQLHKEHRVYPSQHRPRSYRSPNYAELQPRRSSATPPKPPSRDYRSRNLANGAPMDKYYRVPKPTPLLQEPTSQNLENGFYESPRSSFYSPNAEVWNNNEGAYSAVSASSTCHVYDLPPSPLRSPLREESLGAGLIGGATNTLADRSQSPLLDLNKSKHLEQPPRFSMVLQSNDYENFNYMPFKKAESEKPNNRRSLKTLEEAMCELETIYNSLQLADEELLDRAEQRTMEEFHYKGFTASPDNFDNEDSISRRKTWGDPALGGLKEEPEVPDRLKDDMAYRRMHPKERPSSVDGHSSLSSISYLMTSPIPSRREMHYIDPKRKLRRKEPDVTLDDVVFRSMHYANNTLKVVEPQPPFGIPLGPITTATDSDYLHTKPTRPEHSRSPYVPSVEPNLVTDDLAFRNLRKDAQPNGPSAASPTPSLGLRKKRAVRSLSANLYGLINSSPATSALELDTKDQGSSILAAVALDGFDNDVPVKRLSRRTSDPEVMRANWHGCPAKSFEVNRNRNTAEPRQKETLSDIDTSNISWDESSDDRIQPNRNLVVEDGKAEFKGSSDRGSSYISSNCSTPSLSQKLEVGTIHDQDQEVSVYKKLCQDLENLVQLTKGIDDVSGQSEIQNNQVVKADSSVLISAGNASGVSLVEEKAERMSVGAMIDSIGNDTAKKVNEAAAETSPIKREISTILDTLKKLGEDSNCSNSSCSERIETKGDVVVDDQSLNIMTKEICDAAAGHKEAEAKPTEEKALNKEKREIDEEEERKDRVDDNVFFRSVQLAKLSGDWKESTPNGAVINRRTSLTSEANWEGMNKCNHKYNSMPAKTSSLLPFRHYGSKRKSNKRKSMCSVS